MTATVVGYNASWTTPIQQVLGSDTITTAPHILQDNAGRVYLMDPAGTCYVLTVPIGTSPDPTITSVFTFNAGGDLQSAIWYASQVWFTSRFTDVYRVYAWDGTTVTLVYSTSDGTGISGSGRGILFANDTDLYLAYSTVSGNPLRKIRVRQYASGAWTDLALNITDTDKTSPRPICASGYSSTWYMMFGGLTGAGPFAWEAFSPTGFGVGDGVNNDLMAAPCFFNGFVYILGDMGDAGDASLILTKLNYSTGAAVTTDLTDLIGPGDNSQSMIVHDGSLYVSSRGLSKLYKSNGTDTLTWEQVS